MARRTKKTASRGSVNNIILESLLSGDKYGYEIIKEVEDKTDGKVKLKKPSLYSSHKRFESKNYIDSYWGDSDIGGRRHYYRITDAGKEYYKKKNTSIFDDDYDEDVDEMVNSETETSTVETPYEYDPHEEEVSYNNKYTFSVEDKMRSLLGDEEEKEEAAEIDDSTPFEDDQAEPELEIESDDKEIINQMYEAINEEKEVNENPQDYEEIEQVDDNYIPDHIFYSPAPLADEATTAPDQIEEHPVEETKEEAELVEEQPDEPVVQTKKSYEIVTDEYGITKLKSDYVEPKRENRIVDNVSGHINYTDYVSEKPKTTTQPTSQSTNNQTINSLNYKDKLSELFGYDEPTQEQPKEIKQASVFEQTEETNTPTPSQSNFIANTTLDKFTKEAQEEGFTVKHYSKQDTTTYKNEYLLVNKLRFVFGIIMGLLMIVQTTAILIGVSACGHLYREQNWVYIVAYIFSLGFAGAFMIPMFISPNAQKSKSIKFNYSMLFGGLAFFVTLILVYAINTFAGLDFTNTAHYISTILVPTILATNFVVGPLVYYVLTKNKAFY